MPEKLIGFIGQGWIGKNYADDFENRGFKTIRYGLEEPYKENGIKIKDCDIVFIAVPTPTTPLGFDSSIVRRVIKKIGQGKIALIKSTVLPGTTESIQRENPGVFVFHSPEFLTEAKAAYDAANPTRNIIGIPVVSDIYRQKAIEVMEVLPRAPYQLICPAKEAELIKYGGNCWFYFKVVYINMLYDLARKLGCSWENIRDALAADPRIGSSHLSPIHKSGQPSGEASQNLKFSDFHLEPTHKSGRGAGGNCFIKDFAAFSRLYGLLLEDPAGQKVLASLEEKNKKLLLSTKKDLDLLRGVYGEDIWPEGEVRREN